MSSRSTPPSRPLTSPRRARGRQAPPQRDRRWRGIALVVALLVAVGIAGAFALRGQSDEIANISTFGDLARDHADGPQVYPQSPPVGGIHNARWQNCGIYDQPVPNENAVHSLEHGAVWITYRPDLPQEAVEQLRNLVGNRSHALLSPYPDLPAPIVSTAWGTQLKADSATDPRLARFTDTYERGRQTPEPGASCRGGVGSPTS